MGDMGDHFRAEKRERAARKNLVITNKVSDAQKAIKNGDRVIVTKDNGLEVVTNASSDAYRIAGAHGTWVIFLEGFSGCYALCRVNPVSP